MPDVNVPNSRLTDERGNGTTALIRWMNAVKAALASGGGSGAPTDAEYVVVSADATLTDERVLAVTAPITKTDGGAGGNLTLGHDVSGVTAASYGTSLKVAQVTVDAKGHTTAAAEVDIATMVGDSGSGGTKGLVPAPAAGDAAASKFLKADGTWAAPSSSGAPNNAAYLTVGNDATLTNERAVAATSPIVFTDGGAGGNGTFSHANSGVSAATYGTSLKVAQVAVNVTGHVTTASEVDIATLVGDSGAGGTKGLVPAPAAGDAAAGKYLKANGSWTALAASGTNVLGLLGNGEDGSATLDGTNTFTWASKSGNDYTLTRNVMLTDCTINGSCTLNPAGFLFQGTGTLTLNGTIRRNGNNGGSGSSNGAALSANFLGGSFAGGGGTTVGAATAGTGGTGVGGDGGAGGSSPSGAGASGGALAIPTGVNGGVYPQVSPLVFMTGGRVGGTSVVSIGAGGGGARGDAGGAGGAGGGGAASIAIAFRYITGSGSITANGGDGGSPAAGATNGGGGGGGGGGAILVATATPNPASVVTITANGGNGGAGKGTGTAGSNGSNGRVTIIPLPA